MTSNIGLRLRHGDYYIVVLPTDSNEFDIAVTDAIGRPAEGDDRRLALEFLLEAVSGLRHQVFDLLGRRKPQRGM